MRLIFSDPTPRWVPFAAVILIVGGVWFASVWQNFEFAFATKFALGLAVVLFIGIFLQGRLFWTGQVDQLHGDGTRYEALTSIWVGRGKRISFTAADISDWTATAASVKAGEPAKPSTVYFTAGTKRLDLSFTNPKLVDMDGLTAMNPAYWAKVKADYPALKSIG
jgi:hypothetical protein